MILGAIFHEILQWEVGPFYARLRKIGGPFNAGPNRRCLIFKTGGIRAGDKGAGVKKGPAEKGPIRYCLIFMRVIKMQLLVDSYSIECTFRKSLYCQCPLFNHKNHRSNHLSIFQILYYSQTEASLAVHLLHYARHKTTWTNLYCFLYQDHQSWVYIR